MKEIVRNSGIDILGKIPWGTHFCQFYKTKEDLIDILVPYFKSGLENNEFCMWITSEPLSAEEAKKSLEREIPNLDDYLRKGQIEIIPYAEWYVMKGDFDSDRVLDAWVSKLNQALKYGYEGLRLTGNTFWLEKEGWNDFVEYEEAVDNIISQYQMIALCTYSLDRCTAAEIVDVINNHEFALIKREGKWDIIENSEHKQTKEEAIQSKRNWEQTFDAVPDLIAILDQEHRVVRVNKAMATKLGLDPDECVGLPCYQAVHGTDEPPSFCPHSQLLKDGCEHTTEVHEENLGGDFIVSASPLYDRAEELMGSVHVARNINERKKAEEAILWNQQRDELLADVSSRLLSSENPQTIIDDLCEKTMEFLGCDLFFNYLVDEQKGCLHLNAYSGIPEEEAKEIEWLDYGVAVCGCAAFESRRIIAENISETPDPRTELVKSYGVQAYACHPLIIEGQTVGTLSFGTNSRTGFTDEEIEVMRTVADHISITLDRIISNHALKEAYDNLEEQVNERASELKKQANLIDLTYDAIFVRNLNDEIIFWNKGAEEMYGWEGENALGTNPNELLNTEFSKPLSEIKAVVLEKGRWEGELTHEKRDGKQITVSSRWSLQKDETNEVIGFLEINNDITETKQAEQALKLASTYNRSLIEASIDPLVTIGPDGKITDVNKSTETVTGRSREELIGTDFSDYFTRPEKARKGYQLVFREGSVVDYPLEIQHRDGSITPVLYNASVYRDEDDEVIGVFAAARDISERKRTEAEKEKLLKQARRFAEELEVSNEELQSTTEELQSTNEELMNTTEDLQAANLDLKLASKYNRSLIEASVDPLVTIGPDGKITDVNESTEKVTGFKRQELIGTDFSDYFTHPDKAREGYEQAFLEGFVRDYPLEIQHISGRVTPVLYNASVYRDGDDEVIGVFAAARDITELRKTEEELRLSYIYNRSLIEASIDPLVTIGPDGKITDVNKSTETVTGRSREELIGTDFSDYFTRPERAREGYTLVFQEGMVLDYPLEIMHKNGHITPVLYNASVYKDESGKVIGVFAAARDINELKKAEEELRLSYIYNRSLIEASIDPLVTIGSDGKLTDVNKSTEKVTGFNRDELMGTDFSDYFTEPEKARKGYQLVFREGSVVDYPLEIQHRDGSITPVLYNASIYRNEDGKVIGVFAAARDITERKIAEAEKQKLLEQEQQLTEELKVSNEELQVTTEELQVTNEELEKQRDELITLNKALKENEKLLQLSNIYNRSLIEASIDPLVTIGPNGKITDVNDSTEDVTGYSRDHLIGTDFSDYFTEPDKARKGYQLVFEKGKVIDYPLEIHHRNGDITSVLYNASVYSDENGKVIGVFAAARDITELKNAEELLKLKINELSRSNAELEQFAYVSSHDLQEPLRMIGSYLQLLERKYEGKLDEKADKYIHFAVDGATRMQNLIDDLLTFSRVTTQANEFKLTDSELILNKVLTNLSVSIKENSATITYDPLPEIMVDDTQMTQLLQNLINNALKFRSKDNPKIHISATEEDKYWLFSVKDNGIGIDPKYSEKIFEVFKRLHKKRDYPGTGIGLSICKKIVERHGGSIWIDSKLGEGSTFYFTMPVSNFDKEEHNET